MAALPATEGDAGDAVMPEPGAAIRAVIVDFGGVMATDMVRSGPPPTGELAAFVDFFQTTFALTYALSDATLPFQRWETGEIDERQFIDVMCTRFEAAGHPPLEREAARRAAITPGLVASLPMVAVIRELHRAGYATAIVTNTGRGATTRWRQVIPVAQLFDVVVDSSVDGVRKPDAAAYLLACRRLGVAPDQCLFIDDRRWNTQAAAALGMRTSVCSDPSETARGLRSRFLSGPAPQPPGRALG